jgi:hypothetical protein
VALAKLARGSTDDLLTMRPRFIAGRFESSSAQRFD